MNFLVKFDNITADEKKMIRKMFFRSFSLYADGSFAKSGGVNFCVSLMPFINKFYKNEEDRKQALQRHMTWFNTTGNVAPFIMGISAAMEKENSVKPDFEVESIPAVKTSLMGPLAGIGDSIFWGVLRVLAAGIAINLGQQGNILAPIVFLVLYNVPSIIVRYYSGFMGYSLGATYIQELYDKGLMDILTKAASTLGLIMAGGMTFNTVSFTTILEYTAVEDNPLVIQDVLDQIFVGLVPLTVTLLSLYFMKTKKVNLNWVILVIVIVSMLLSVLGIA